MMNEYEENRWPYEYIYTAPFYDALLFCISKQLWIKEPIAKKIPNGHKNSRHLSETVKIVSVGEFGIK